MTPAARMTYAELAGAVHAQLGSSRRYEHVVRVARLAERLAHRHGEDSRKARLAGMLHDLARLYSAGRLTDESERRGLVIDAFARAHPIVLHAPLSAELARERFGVNDETVLSAICRHTLAAPQMSRLDEILYLADGLEPGRTFAERPALERLAFEDVDAAMLATLRASIDFLHGRSAAVAPQTLEALAVYEERSSVCPT
jgi:predicted HD superfamily hydrolase involved in NAD metabolism